MITKFERGKSVRKVLDIGINPLEVEGISKLKSINYSEFGESWDWKFIKPKRRRKIHKILSLLENDRTGGSFSIWTPDGNFYTPGVTDKKEENYEGKSFIFEGKVYKMPKNEI